MCAEVKVKSFKALEISSLFAICFQLLYSSEIVFSTSNNPIKAHNWCLPDTFYLSSQMFGKVASGKSNFSTQLYIPSKSVNCLCYLRFDCLSRRARVGHLITSATCPNPAVVCTITLLFVKKLNLADKRRWEILKELKCY